MKRTALLITCFFTFLAYAEDFYLPLVGYSQLDKATKTSTQTDAIGVCCLEGHDMFIYINKTKIDCRSIENPAFDEYSDQTATLSTEADVVFNCDAPIRMRIVLNFVDKMLTNIYLRGDETDYEFYLGEIQSTNE